MSVVIDTQSGSILDLRHHGWCFKVEDKEMFAEMNRC